jgi:hypothetical protein
MVPSHAIPKCLCMQPVGSLQPSPRDLLAY